MPGANGWRHSTGQPMGQARAVFPEGAFCSPVATRFPVTHVPSPTGTLLALGSPQAGGGTGALRAGKKRWEENSLSGGQAPAGTG